MDVLKKSKNYTNPGDQLNKSAKRNYYNKFYKIAAEEFAKSTDYLSGYEKLIAYYNSATSLIKIISTKQYDNEYEKDILNYQAISILKEKILDELDSESDLDSNKIKSIKSMTYYQISIAYYNLYPNHKNDNATVNSINHGVISNFIFAYKYICMAYEIDKSDVEINNAYFKMKNKYEEYIKNK